MRAEPVESFRGFIDAVTTRLDSTASSLSSLRAYVRARARAARITSRSVTDLPTLPASCEVLKSFDKAESAAQSDFSDALSGPIAKDLDSACEAVSSASKTFVKKVRSVVKEIEQKRQTVANANAALIASMREAAAAAMDQQQQQQRDEVDPWLILARYCDRWNELAGARAEFIGTIAKLSDDAIKVDADASKVLAAAVKRILHLQQEALAKLAWEADRSSKGAEAAFASTASGEFATSVQRQRADLAKSAEESKSFSTRSALKSPVITKRVDLELDGLLSWKKVTVLVTRFGFMHLLKQAADRDGSCACCEPDTTLSLCYTTTEVVNVVKHVFSVVQNKPGLFNREKSFTLRAPNDDVMVDLIIELRKFRPQAAAEAAQPQPAPKEEPQLPPQAAPQPTAVPPSQAAEPQPPPIPAKPQPPPIPAKPQPPPIPAKPPPPPPQQQGDEKPGLDEHK